VKVIDVLSFPYFQFTFPTPGLDDPLQFPYDTILPITQEETIDTLQGLNPFQLPDNSSIPSTSVVPPTPISTSRTYKNTNGEITKEENDKKKKKLQFRLNHTKSAKLASTTTSSSASSSRDVTLQPPLKVALFDAPRVVPPPQPSTSTSILNGGGITTKNNNNNHLQSSALTEEVPFFFAPNGRSLRARGVRPSYLEIPPSALPPPTDDDHVIASGSSTRDTSRDITPTTTTVIGVDPNAVELLKVSGKLVKRFKKWAKERKKTTSTTTIKGKGKGKEKAIEEEEEEDEEEESSDEGVKVKLVVRKNKRKKTNSDSSGGEESSLSSLSTSSDDDTIDKHKKKKKKKKQQKKRIRTNKDYEQRDEGDSSPLSSLDDDDDSGSDSSSLSSLSTVTGRRRILAFPDKPLNHPLNRTIKLKPKPPPVPPRLEVFKEYQESLNRFSWVEGLREITLNREIVQPTYDDDDDDEVSSDDEDDDDVDVEGGVINKKKKKKKMDSKKPGWEWEINDRSVSPLPLSTLNHTTQGTSLAHPPSGSSSFLSVPTSTSNAPPTLTTKQPLVVVPRPKTYRQIAKLDWSDFHQRYKCRFTTSGSIEGVNPESLPWEDWFGIENDEKVENLLRLNDLLDEEEEESELVVFSEKGLNTLSGIGGGKKIFEKEFEKVLLEDSFGEYGGMEWNNEWRYKTLEEGMGRCWEDKCRWAVRNPEQKYLSDSSSSSSSTSSSEDEGVGIREKLEAERRQRKRERKKAKREKLRKEREGSGGESELTPLEGEDLSTDSDETEEEIVKAIMSAAAIAKKSSLIMQQAADAHAASGKAGVMVVSLTHRTLFVKN